MTVYGYFRCSTNFQDEERQIRALKDAEIDFISGDKITGTSDFNSRSELSKLLKKMESGRFSLFLNCPAYPEVS